MLPQFMAPLVYDASVDKTHEDNSLGQCTWWRPPHACGCQHVRAMTCSLKVNQFPVQYFFLI